MFILLSEKWERSAFALTLLIVIGFLCYGDYLPMLDLPQHASQITLLDDLLKQKSPWANLVQLNWDTPYLVIYLTWLLVYQFTDALTSSKVMMILILLAYVASIRLLRKALGANRLVDWGALTVFFGFAFQFGLVSYLGAIPIGIVFFLANQKYLQQKSPKYLAYITILGVLMYLSHVLIFAFFCFLAYAYFLACQIFPSAEKRLSWRNRIHLTLPYLFFAAIFIRYVKKPSLFAFQYYSVQIEYPTLWEKTTELLYLPWNMNWLDYYDLACLGMLILPILMGFRLSRQPEKYIPLLGFLLIWYALPDKAFQTGFVYQRFAIFLLPFYYLLWEKRGVLSTTRHNLAQISSLFFLASVGVLLFKVGYNQIRFQEAAATRDFKHVLSQMQENKRVLGVFEPNLRGSGELTSDMEYLYFANWYQAQKRGWADFNFAAFHPQIVRFQAAHLPENYGKNRSMHPTNLSRNLDCRTYDYLLMRTHQNPTDIEAQLQQNPHCQQMRTQIATPEWLLFTKQ